MKFRDSTKPHRKSGGTWGTRLGRWTVGEAISS
jgi:hypothetical protein